MNILTTIAAFIALCVVVDGGRIPGQGLQSIFLVNKQGRDMEVDSLRRSRVNLSQKATDRTRRHIFGPCKSLLTRRSQGVPFKIMNRITLSKLRRICGKRIFRFAQRLDFIRCDPKFLSCS